MLVALLCAGFTSAWAEEVTKSVTLSDGTFETDHITWTLDDVITITQTKGNSGTPVNSSYISNPRFYQDHVILFEATSGITLNSIVISGPTGTGSYSISKFGENEGWMINSTDGTATWTGSASSISITAKAQVRPTGITITYSTSGGTVTPTCATPTFSPAAGAVFAGTEVSINCSTTGASIYYTTNGNKPSASEGTLYEDPIEINEATTIKAIAVKDGAEDSEVATAEYTIKQAISGFNNIDFESDLDCYVDWTFTNAEKSTGAITAHGGTYYATTGGKTTAVFQTKEKVAYPNVFTCYVSKTSTNATASTWEIQVSSDRSSWIKVAEKSATNMDKGEWSEFTADIKAAGYTDVYVRLYYSGSTAVRTVDDISLTTYTPAAVEEPIITVAEEFTFSTTATITCVTEGATIYYSFDNVNWTEYTDALTLTATTTIYAKAVKGEDESSVAQATATKVLVTPEVTISATTINIGQTATVSTVGPAVTLSTSDDTIASVEGTTVTGVAEGEATITATWVANSDYSAGTKAFTVIITDPNKPGASAENPYTVAQAIANTPESGTSAEVFIRGKVSAFYSTDGTIIGDNYHRYYISEDGTQTAEQLLVYNGKGLNNDDFANEEDLIIGDVVVIYGGLTTYKGTKEVAADNYIVSLIRTKQNPTIVVNETETIVYGNTFTVDDSMIEGGEITVTSSNTSVATVNGLVITPVAVGQTTITVATAEDAFYNAGSETFTLTVTAPTAMSTAAPAASGDFVKVTSTTGIKNGDYLIVYKDETELDNSVAFNGGLETLDAANNVIAVSINNDKIEASDETKAATFKIDATAGTLQSKNGHYIGVSSNNNGLKQTDDANKFKNSFEIGNDGYAVISAVFEGSDMSLRFNSASGNNRFRYYKSGQQPIQLYKLDEGTSIEVTLNGSGYATYCNQYPLDFTDRTDVTAWALTGIEKDEKDGDVYKMNYTQIKGVVKGGVGMLLKGTAGATVSLTSVGGDYVPGDNKFVGTLAPTFVEAGTVYGLSGDTFVKSKNAGNVKANKAYIPADKLSTEAKSFIFVFEDEATGVRTIETHSAEDAKAIFNIAGQRLQNMQKGINIVGGKKILVK